MEKKEISLSLDQLGIVLESLKEYYPEMKKTFDFLLEKFAKSDH